MKIIPRIALTSTLTLALGACAAVSDDTNADGLPADTGASDSGDAGSESDAADGRSDAGPSDADARPDSADAAGVAVVLNEVAPSGDPADWVEFHNPTARDIDLAEWGFSDDPAASEARAMFPVGTIVPAGGYLVVDVTDEWPGFGLGSDEGVALFDDSGALVDATDWEEGVAPAGTTWGRFPNATGEFRQLATPTPGQPNTDASAPGSTCGDGTLDVDEACDDANNTDGDGCSSECAVEEPTPACGDGNLDAGEECDDANTRDGDGCDASCRHEVSDPRCGDGRVDDGEECDDANTRDGDGCDAACQVEVSGPACGDGVRDGDEECDDANTRDGDGCSAECLTESTRVVLNEIVAGSTDGSPDAVELFNPGATTVRLDGWYFTDEDPTHVFSFAPDTAIAPGSYLVVVRDDLGGGFTFGLGADDALSLFDSTSVLIDSTDWADGDAPIDGSWARSPNGSGSWVARVTASLGRSND